MNEKYKTQTIVDNMIDNKLYLQKLKKNKRYKKVPTSLNKYNSYGK
jgi:hypothetical protein